MKDLAFLRRAGLPALLLLVIAVLLTPPSLLAAEIDKLLAFATADCVRIELAPAKDADFAGAFPLPMWAPPPARAWATAWRPATPRDWPPLCARNKALCRASLKSTGCRTSCVPTAFGWRLRTASSRTSESE